MTANPQVTATPGSDPPAPIKWPKPDFSEPFKDLAFIGDDKLNALCKRVSVSIWGRQNRKLVKKVQDDWVSNDNWLFLAIVYRLDLFVGTSFRAPTPVAISHANRTSTSTTGAISPAHSAGTTPQHPGTAYTRKIIYDPAKPLIVNKQRGKETYAFLKSWADLWEAYFGSLIEEREVWHEPLLDIEMFIRRLMVRKYRGLLPFAMNLDVQYTLRGYASDGELGDAALGHGVLGDRDTTDYVENLARSCVEKTIRRTDEVIESLFGKKVSGESLNPWGRLIVFPEGRPGDASAGGAGGAGRVELAELETPEMVRAERRRFTVDGYDDGGIAELLYGCREGLEGILPYPRASHARAASHLTHHSCAAPSISLIFIHHVFMLTHLVLPTTEHDESTRANLNDPKPEMHFRQKMFDILIKTWCRRARPVQWGGRSVLSTAALEGALEQVRALRVELVKEISQGTGAGAGTVGFQGGRDRLALYESKLIAMTFLYEVRLPSPVSPSHLRPLVPSPC